MRRKRSNQCSLVLAPVGTTSCCSLMLKVRSGAVRSLVALAGPYWPWPPRAKYSSKPSCIFLCLALSLGRYMSVRVVLLRPRFKLISLLCALQNVGQCIFPESCFSTDKLKIPQEWTWAASPQVHPWYLHDTPNKVMECWDLLYFSLNVDKMSLTEEVQVFVVVGNWKINRSHCAGTGHQ